jgi:uncharacterized membrane protein YqgA involved in biofilm formation
MLGTVVNTSTIIVGSVVGTLLGNGIEERYKERTIQAMGLVAMAIGISNINEGMGTIIKPVVFILSMAIGAVLGEWIDLDGKIENINKKYEGKQSPVQGIIIGVMLFCIGALSIIGPIESALKGDNTMLFANAMLDGVTSIILSINYGLSITWVALILFLWQGLIYFTAGQVEAFLSPEILNQLTLLGGILILATGINILGLGKIKTLNLLPALAVTLIIGALNLI